MKLNEIPTSQTIADAIIRAVADLRPAYAKNGEQALGYRQIEDKSGVRPGTLAKLRRMALGENVAGGFSSSTLDRLGGFLRDEMFRLG